jgi:TonB family protein
LRAIETSDMSQTWKRWEGRTVDASFPLQSYLGGSDHSAVFLTLTQGGAGDSGKAAIKLLPADSADAEKQILQWMSARDLIHPNLIRIYEAGRCELDDTALLYVVEEYAEENLSQILPERALTAEETRGMLSPILRALQYVHDKGFVHGHIQPSNILAIGDQVKLSSDALGVPGERHSATTSPYDPPEGATGGSSTAGDVWQLGMTLIEALTQHLPVGDSQQNEPPAPPNGIPQPFREIVENCLRIDPARRWTVAQIADRLQPGQSETASQGSVAALPSTQKVAPSSRLAAEDGKESAKWPYAIALVAAVLVVLFLVTRPKAPAGPPPPQTAREQNVSTPRAAPSTQGPVSKSTPNTATKRTVSSRGVSTTDSTSTAAEPAQAASEGRVVERVIPQVSPGALRSITGKIRIQVRVNVDKAGNVAEVRLKTPGPSKYFAARALEAARGWKFKPALENGQPVASQWIVQFTLTRRAIDDSLVRIEP